MRRIYLDNVRWAAVLLVLIYHVCYLFNGVGVPGAVPGAANIPAFDALEYVVYPWIMVLLFVVAGMSARYSLERRTAKQFLRERAAKLLVPSTLGLFVIHWITGYLNIKMGGGLDMIPTFLVYPLSVISGVGPLWFIQMLFLLSCLLVLLRRIERGDRIWRFCGKANLPIILLLCFPIYGAAQILNVPVLVPYRFGIYTAAFLIGYYFFSHDEVQVRIARAALPMACIAAAGAVLCTLRYFGEDYTSPHCLRSLFTNCICGSRCSPSSARQSAVGIRGRHSPA